MSFFQIVVLVPTIVAQIRAGQLDEPHPPLNSRRATGIAARMTQSPRRGI